MTAVLILLVSAADALRAAFILAYQIEWLGAFRLVSLSPERFYLTPDF